VTAAEGAEDVAAGGGSGGAHRGGALNSGGGEETPTGGGGGALSGASARERGSVCADTSEMVDERGVAGGGWDEWALVWEWNRTVGTCAGRDKVGCGGRL
jgi:hypothetical protein